MGVNAIAALWGLAEATLFFIVPDVWLTVIAAWSPRRACIACVFVLVGALAGGALMYGWGAVDPETVLTTLDYIPAIHPAMLSRVADELQQFGLLAPFLGPSQGVPYKIYAAQASRQGIGFASFLLVSIPARMIRFVLVTSIACVVTQKLCAAWTPRRRILLLGSGWVAFYTWYLLSMPN